MRACACVKYEIEMDTPSDRVCTRKTENMDGKKKQFIVRETGVFKLFIYFSLLEKKFF